MTRRRLMPAAQFAVDAAVWAAALFAASWMRLDFATDRLHWDGIAAAVALAAVAQVAVGRAIGLYRRRWQYGSFHEVIGLSIVLLVVGTVVGIPTLFDHRLNVPRSVPPMATALAASGTVAARAFWRLVVERSRRPEHGEPIVVLGAGDGGSQIVRTLNSNPRSPYRPVALLDDDPLKARLRIDGVRVTGTLAGLADVAAALDVRTVLFAIPSAGSEVMRQVHDTCTAADLDLLVLPSIDAMLGTPVLADIRPVSNVDLLGRAPADIDTAEVAGYVAGRRVLVTGAGGSIGSELCRQLSRLEPATLVMLDRDESGLHATQLSIEGRALLDSPDLVLADIRDHDRIREVFERHRPQVVFHAAALKHLPLLQAAPDEAWKTNVLGSHHVLEAAAAVGVERFVNISTDKAANPTSVLGTTKRVTERLTAHRATTADGSYVSVRFGNVLGSRGSVLTSFRVQADAGGPITVTHPDVTRYFMTIEEAVRLTIVAGSIGRSGDVLVLDMGRPVRIAELAARFAEQYSPVIDIEYTGLRPGEKLHEDLIADDETPEPSDHPAIVRIPVPAMSLGDAVSLMTR